VLEEGEQIAYDDVELPDARGGSREVRLVVGPVDGARASSSFGGVETLGALVKRLPTLFERMACAPTAATSRTRAGATG
jgi:hypothetical protein